MNTMTMAMLLIPGDGIMNGFCYNYSKALLEKLKELREKKRLFKPGPGGCTTTIAEAVIRQLGNQGGFSIAPRTNDDKDVVELIQATEEFLSIFKKED